MKYAPKKVFVLEGKTYLELSYAEFRQQAGTYQGRRFISLHGMLMEVSEDAYKAFYKDKRRQKYLNERSNDNGDFSYDMLTTDEFNGEDSEDIIKMPPKAKFISELDYYDTLFHECAHSTGAESRLDRELQTKDKEKYAVDKDLFVIWVFV